MPIKYIAQNKSFFPVLIISNMSIILSINFLVKFILINIINKIMGLVFHEEQIMGFNQYDFMSSYTTCAIFSLILESVIMIGVFVVIVEKANKLLDYSISNEFFQILLIILFTGFPNNAYFWIVNTIKVILITVISEFIALKIEQKEIFINTNFITGNGTI